MSDEISGQGYTRGGDFGGDNCPNYVPIMWSDPDSVTFEDCKITFTLLPKAVERHEIRPGVWFEVDERGYMIWDFE